MWLKNKKGLLVSALIVLVIIFGYWYLKNTNNASIIAPITEEKNMLEKGEVSIENNIFIPNPLTISVGENVTWINNEPYEHDVVSDTGLFKSPKMATGEKYSYTFTKEGTFTYICGIHPFMHGTIIVTK